MMQELNSFYWTIEWETILEYNQAVGKLNSKPRSPQRYDKKPMTSALCCFL